MVHTKDDFGLGVSEGKFSYGIKLTSGEAKLIKDKIPYIYKIDGKSFFEVKSDDKFTGELMFFVYFE